MKREGYLDAPVLEFLGEAEVGEFEVSLAVEQQVLRLEIAVDEAERMKVVEREDDLGGVEQSRAGGEATGVTQVGEQLSAAHVLQQHVQKPLVVIRPQPAHVATHAPALHLENVTVNHVKSAPGRALLGLNTQHIHAHTHTHTHTHTHILYIYAHKVNAAMTR